MSLETRLSECRPCLFAFFLFSPISCNDDKKTFGCIIAHWRLARCLYEEDMIALRLLVVDLECNGR